MYILRCIMALVVAALACAAPVAMAQDFDFYTDCEKYPDSLACSPVGDPAPPEEIPREERNIQLQNGPVFSGGGCPADVTINIHGRPLRILTMAQTCSWIQGWIKPFILFLASFSAVFIIFPRD